MNVSAQPVARLRAAGGAYRSRGLRLASLAILVLLAAVGSVFLGAVSLSPHQVWSGLFRSLPEDSAWIVLSRIRLPRIVLSACVGAALSLSGTLLQAFFQNPMAGPYVVGVSSGAGLAAVAVITLGLVFRFGPFDAVSVAAFAGGLGAVALVYLLARKVRLLQAEGLLLIGIAVGAVLSALTALLLVFGPEGPQAALYWMLGSFAMARWSAVVPVLVILGIGGPFALLKSRDLNVLLWGEDVAQSLGTSVRRTRIWILVLSSLLTASAVAASGTVGFVGLMEPHLARGYLRTADHRFVLPGSALIGALVVLAADALARTAFAPLELPVGAITSALGAPFLVWLVIRRHARLTAE